MESITDFDHIASLVASEPGLLLYASTPSCGVCQALKPKVEALMAAEFPRMALRYLDIELIPQARGQYSIFNVPVVLAFFGGKENFRLARNFGIGQLAQALQRPYGFLFGAG